MAEERLQKIISGCGLCSRRKAEDLIRDGRVTVNGRVAELGQKADPASDHIKVNGRMLKAADTTRYILLYKPREVMTTCDDPEGRRTVIDLLGGEVRERVFPVGRLDYHSEGLLILTNDGAFAARVTHPRYGVVREYVAKIRSDLTDDELRRLLRGTRIEGQMVKPLSARRERAARDGSNTWWRVEITEGRTHEVRELFFRSGHHVQRLKRVGIGPIREPLLKPGQFRELEPREVKALLAATRRTTAPTPTAAERDAKPQRDRGARQAREGSRGARGPTRSDRVRQPPRRGKRQPSR